MKVTKKLLRGIVAGYVVFCVIILGLTIGMTLKQGVDSRNILEESIESQLISITKGALDILDTAQLDTYKTAADLTADYADFDNDPFYQVVKQLDDYRKGMEEDCGVEIFYIYTIKYISDTGKYHLIIDTDEVDNDPAKEAEIIASGEEYFPPFSDYELWDVHKDAFAGKISAGVRNVSDEYGSWNTCAIPVYASDGKTVTAVICTDISDALITQNIKNFNTNIIILSVVLGVTLIGIGVLLYRLLLHVKKMQDQLSRIANYDKLTDLPNRRYLLDQLAEITNGKKKQEPFALFFVDLDNFKKVNDNAGHDAGDALLQHIALYLQSAQQSLKVFRPGSGSLNVAARVGGDEFILIVPGITTPEEAGGFAKELLIGFKGKEVDKYIDKYEVGLSIGVALYPEHTENFHVLIKYADIAMYHAKHGGKNNFEVYRDEMSDKSQK